MLAATNQPNPRGPRAWHYQGILSIGLFFAPVSNERELAPLAIQRTDHAPEPHEEEGHEENAHQAQKNAWPKESDKREHYL